MAFLYFRFEKSWCQIILWKILFRSNWSLFNQTSSIITCQRSLFKNEPKKFGKFSEHRNFRVFDFRNFQFSGNCFWTFKSVSSFGCFNPSWNIFRKCSSWSRWWMACYDSSRLVFSFALAFSWFLIGWELILFWKLY